MFSTLVLIILFFIGLGAIWVFLISMKANEKLARKVKKFTEENLIDNEVEIQKSDSKEENV